MEEYLDIERSKFLYDSGVKPKNNKLWWFKTVEYNPLKKKKIPPKESKWKVGEYSDTITITQGFTNVIKIPVYTINTLLDLIPSEEIYIKRIKGKWEVSCFGEKDFGITGKTQLEALWNLINLMIDLGLL